MTEPRDNPFEILGLDPAAPDEEVVRQAGRLRQQAGDEGAVTAIRQAVQALTGRPEERRLHELLTHPRPCYRWPAVEAFAAAFQRLSPPPGGQPAEPDLSETAALLRALLGERDSPVAGEAQVVAALWQCLLFDSLA